MASPSRSRTGSTSPMHRFSFTFIVLLLQLISGCLSSEAEDRLMQNLTEKSLKSRPASRHTDTVNVVLGVAIRQIVDVDEIGEKLVVSMWRRLKWSDYRLTWDPAQYDGIDSVTIPLQDVWTPDVVLYNSVETEDDPPDNAVISVTSDGGCSYYPFGVYSSQCPMDIRWFPMDDQFCPLDFVSWSYDSQKLNISIQQEQADLKFFKSSTEWDLIDVTGKVELLKYECCDIPYSFISYTVHLRRKVLYYVFNLICPCALISFITCLAFFLPIDSGERTGLCITTLLALTVYQIIVLDRIPASSESTPLIGIFFITLICINTAAMLMTLLTTNIHYRTGMFYQRPPHWVRKYICKLLARYLCMSLKDSERNGKPDSSRRNHVASETGKNDSERGSGPWVATRLDSSLSRDLENEYRGLVNPVREETEDDLVEREWKYTALVLDRACFYFFLFVLILSSFCIFVSATGK